MYHVFYSFGISFDAEQHYLWYSDFTEDQEFMAWWQNINTKINHQQDLFQQLPHRKPILVKNKVQQDYFNANDIPHLLIKNNTLFLEWNKE